MLAKPKVHPFQSSIHQMFYPGNIEPLRNNMVVHHLAGSNLMLGYRGEDYQQQNSTTDLGKNLPLQFDHYKNMDQVLPTLKYHTIR